MYRLRDLNNGLYQIHKQHGEAFEGKLEAIKTVAISMGIDHQDFDIAVFELEFHEHDYAEFGIYGRFMYTKADQRVA